MKLMFALEESETNVVIYKAGDKILITIITVEVKILIEIFVDIFKKIVQLEIDVVAKQIWEYGVNKLMKKRKIK